MSPLVLYAAMIGIWIMIFIGLLLLLLSVVSEIRSALKEIWFLAEKIRAKRVVIIGDGTEIKTSETSVSPEP